MGRVRTAMKRILITGASGFLGSHLALSLKNAYEVRGTFARRPVDLPGCPMERLDFTSGSSGLSALIERFRPDVVIHAAALIDIDLCEREPVAARRINEDAVRQVASAAAAARARLVYFSTDMVFDGRKGMYAEDDEPSPLTVYGRTKLAGERLALGLCPGSVVARLSLMYGTGSAEHGSFLGWMRARLEKGEALSLFTDQYRTPLYVRDVCRAVERILRAPGIRGLYHLAGPDRMNRFDFGRKTAEVFGFPERLLRPVLMEEMPGLIPRPKDNSMDNRKAVRDLGIRFAGAVDGLRAVARGGGQ